MKNRLHKRLSAWLLTLVMLVGMLPAMASADEVGEDLAPPAPQEENYGYVRLVFAEGEQLDLCHGEYITECSPTAEIFSGADEDFIANGEYAALYYEGKLYCKAALDGVSINADAVLPAEAFALVPMGEKSALAAKPEDESSGSDETVGTPPSTESEPPALPESKEEDKTTEDEGGSSGSDYDIGDDTRPQGSMRMPVMPTAAGQYPAASEVCVDGSKYFAEPGCYYFKNGATACSKDSSGSNATYNPTTGTLTLDGYKGGSITVGGTKSKITVVLVGDNTITNGSLTSAWGGDITIKSSGGGTLSISKTMNYSGVATGIEAGYGGSQTTGNVTITGDAKVTIKMTHNGTGTYERAYGIFARENITICENASVDITCATPYNTTTDGELCSGLRAVKDVIIDTTGKVKIDVTNAGDGSTYSFGIYPSVKATLTNVGEMEVKWKKHASISRYPGGAVLGGDSFDTSTHAVNVDTTNCYASYRKGAPYTVTVNNGDLAGPGVVPYAKNNGNFLAGDTVNITPSEKKSNSGAVIPFKEWTAEGVKITNPTSPSNSFTVPNKNVTVTAKHDPFDGKPTFTPTGSTNTTGTLTFKTLVKPHDGNEYFRLVKEGNENNESSYNLINPDTTSTSRPYEYSYETSIYSLNKGNYYVAELLNGAYYLSEKFTVNYTAAPTPTTNISVSNWPGTTVFPDEEEGYAFAQGRILTIDNKGEADTGELTITVEGANPTAFTVSPNKISNIAVGGKAESTVRPAKDLPAGIYTATLKISGANVNTLSINVKFTVKGVTSSLIGDVNKDGVINGQDLQRLYEHLKGENPLPTEDVSLGDVNGDSNVNGQDWQRLYEHVKGEKPLT